MLALDQLASRRRVHRLLAFAALFCSALTGCKAGKGEVCSGDDACSSGLVCLEQACRDPASYCRETEPHASACSRDGRCVLDSGRCVVREQADCDASQRCKKYGHCKLGSGCCSSDGRCRSEGDDPLPLIDALASSGEAPAALDKLDRLISSTLMLDGGDPKGKHAAPLLDDVVAPLAAIANKRSLGPAEQAKLLTILANGRHPDSDGALVEALRLYRFDRSAATPLDKAMGRILESVAARKVDAAADHVLPLYQAMNLGAPKARVAGLVRGVEHAIVALAKPAWEKALIDKLGEQPASYDDIPGWRNHGFWQITAARALGALASTKAIDPLLQVVLSPGKVEVHTAAYGALAAIGQPAATRVRALLEESDEAAALLRFSDQAHASARAGGLESTQQRDAKAMRRTAAVVALVHSGTSADVKSILEAAAELDPVGKGVVALQLHKLPPSPEVREGFKSIYNESPVDLPVSTRHQGLDALLETVPWFFDPAMVDWIVKGAVAVEGSDTELAAFREAALDACMLLVPAGGEAKLDALAELITASKHAAQRKAAAELAAACKDDPGCYLERLQKAEPQRKAPAIELHKAAVMVGVLGKREHAEAIIDLMAKHRSPALRHTLLAALLHVVPAGDAALAERASKALRVRGELIDATTGEALVRLARRAAQSGE